MAGDDITYADYVRVAFGRKVHVPLLGDMPLNQMALLALGVLGIANPGFWLLGAAFELAFLFFRSSGKRFQKLVQAERLMARQQGWEERVQAMFERLPAAAQLRYQALLTRCGSILGITAPIDRPGMLQDLRAGTLNQLLSLFLRLLASREAIAVTLAQVDQGELEGDVARLQERVAAAEAESPLARSLAATLEIQKQRLANLDTARKNLAVVDAELERIEQQVRLIGEESAVAGGPEFLSARLDAVSTTLQETSRWMDQHAEFFRSLGGEELEEVPAVLPRLPAPATRTPLPPPPPKVGEKG